MLTFSEKNFGETCVSGGCAKALVCDSGNVCACASQHTQFHAGSNVCENSEFNKWDINVRMKLGDRIQNCKEVIDKLLNTHRHISYFTK